MLSLALAACLNVVLELTRCKFKLRVASWNFTEINLRVASSFLRVAKQFRELQIHFASCKLNYELLFSSCKFQEIILRVAGCASCV